MIRSIGTLKAPILTNLQDFVRMCQRDMGGSLYLYRYLTIQSSVVKRGTHQRAKGWHRDNPNESFPIYMCVEGQPTELWGMKSKALEVYRCDSADLHRSPKVKRTHHRTFLRLAYSSKLLKYTGKADELNLLVLH